MKKIVFTLSNSLTRSSCTAILFLILNQSNSVAQIWAPLIYCTPHSVSMMDNGATIPFWASDFFEYAVAQNGFVENSLRLRIFNQDGEAIIGGTSTGYPSAPTSNFYQITCDDGGASVYIAQLWGKDSLGNSDFCSTTITVNDPEDYCHNNPFPNVIYSGGTTSTNLQGMPDITYNISGFLPSAGPFSAIQISGIDGKYDLSSFPSATNIQITASKNLPVATTQGISAYDIVLIHKHIIGHTLLSSPYTMLVADVNASNHITGADITTIKKFVLGITDHLPQPDQYVFFAESYVFANPTNPFSQQNTGNPFVVNIPVLLENTTEQNFLAFKYGDVSGDALLTNDAVEDRNLPTAYIHAEDRYVRAGEVFEVKFQTAESFTAYQFTMDLQGLEVVEILPGEGMTSDDFALLNASKTVTAVVANETARAFSIRFKATQSGNLSDMIHATHEVTPSLAYDEEGKESEIAFRFRAAPAHALELYPSTPNPFIEVTNIRFGLQDAAKVTLRIHDAYGRTLHSQTAQYTEGQHSIAFTSEQVKASGVLYYSLETENDKLVGQMVKLK